MGYLLDTHALIWYFEDSLNISDRVARLIDDNETSKDPFDRLLISSALAENLTIITIDENIQKYDVPWCW